MIHTSAKKTKYQYPNSINFHWAIDQFQTIFNYIGDIHPLTNNVNVNTNVTPTKWYNINNGNTVSDNISNNIGVIRGNYEIIQKI